MPSDQDFGVLDKKYNVNILSSLASTELGISALGELFSLGFIPRSQDLRVKGTLNDRNFWYYLLRSENGFLIIQKYLLPRNIFPDYSDLSEVDKKDGMNSWGRMLSSEIGIEIFRTLMKKGNFPSSMDLSHVNFNTEKDSWIKDSWFHLIENNNYNDSLFMTLIDNDIYPSWERLIFPYFDNSLNLFDFIKAKKNSFKSSDYSKILNKLEIVISLMEELRKFYNIPTDTKLASFLISDPDERIFRQNFLYFFYQVTKYDLPLPIDILLIIGQIFLKNLTLQNFIDLDSNDNRINFAKYYSIEQLDRYSINRFSFHKHCERAASFKEAIRIEKDPRKTIVKQYFNV